MTILLGALAVLVIIGLQLILLFRKQDSNKIESLDSRLNSLDSSITKVENTLRDEMGKNRQELSGTLKSFGDTSSKQLIGLTGLNEQKLNDMRKTVEDRLKAMQDDNSQKLEKIRQTVDKELHDTLEQRLGQSFQLVCDRLDQVHRGLGEMQTLAIGVGDLKKVLSNVRTRGTLGEVQLGAILEQILTPEQYATKVATKPRTRENVEFAIKLPG